MVNCTYCSRDFEGWQIEKNLSHLRTVSNDLLKKVTSKQTTLSKEFEDLFYFRQESFPWSKFLWPPSINFKENHDGRVKELEQVMGKLDLSIHEERENYTSRSRRDAIFAGNCFTYPELSEKSIREEQWESLAKTIGTNLFCGFMGLSVGYFAFERYEKKDYANTLLCSLMASGIALVSLESLAFLKDDSLQDYYALHLKSHIADKFIQKYYVSN